MLTMRQKKAITAEIQNRYIKAMFISLAKEYAKKNNIDLNFK